MKNLYYLLCLLFLLPALPSLASIDDVSFNATMNISLGEDGLAAVEAADFSIDTPSCPDGTPFSFRFINTDQGDTNIYTFNCDQVGSNDLFIEVSDCCGNSKIVEVIANVQDNLNTCDCSVGCCFPQIQSVDGLAVALAFGASVTIPAFTFDIGSVNPCNADPLTFSFSPDPLDQFRTFTCDNIGFNPVTLFAHDGQGNTNMVTAFVLVNDPLQLCPGMTGPCVPVPVARIGEIVTLSEGGIPAIVRPTDFNLGCYLDACSGGTELTYSFSSDPDDQERTFDCEDIGTNTLELWITDDLGNQSSINVIVLVQDNNPTGLGCDGGPTIQNDNVCDAIDITGQIDCVSNTYANIGASSEPNEIFPTGSDCSSQSTWCGGDSTEVSVWFMITAPPSGNLSISTTGFDTQLALWQATDCSQLTNGEALLIAANDDNPGDDTFGSSLDNITCLIPGQTYYLQVDGYAGSAGFFSLSVADLGVDCEGLSGGEEVACESLDMLADSSGGFGEWIHLYAANGAVLASINDQGQELGLFDLDVQLHTGPIRTDSEGNLYHNQNWSITSVHQPDTPVRLRLYTSLDELGLLQQASSTIESPEDLWLTRVPEGTCGDFSGLGVPPQQPLSFWESAPGTLALEFEVDGFSTFYLHGPGGLFSSQEDLVPSPHLTLYPNPASEQLQISWSQPASQLRIMDLQGRTVFIHSLDPGQRTHSISIEQLVPGMYLLEWTGTQGQRQLLKWVKE
jgi:hypothetical protein